jgi:hypothetical protein
MKWVDDMHCEAHIDADRSEGETVTWEGSDIGEQSSNPPG